MYRHTLYIPTIKGGMVPPIAREDAIVKSVNENLVELALGSLLGDACNTDDPDETGAVAAHLAHLADAAGREDIGGELRYLAVVLMDRPVKGMRLAGELADRLADPVMA